MNKSQKKEIFLKVLSNLFSDNTKEIDEDNCIGFYHYLIDNLINEESGEKEESALCRELIFFLSNFDIMFIDFRITNTIVTDRKKIIKLFMETTGLSELGLINTLAAFRKIYIYIKDGFLLSSY